MTKKKETPEEAAQRVLMAAKEKKQKAATDELNSFLKNWSQKNKSALVVKGEFSGNQIQSQIVVVILE